MAKKTALRPDFFANFESLKQNVEAAKKGVSEDEQAFYSMSLTKGWTLFNNLTDDLLDEMDGLIDASIASGATREQIGENTIVVSLAKGIIKRLINKVEDAREACTHEEIT